MLLARFLLLAFLRRLLLLLLPLLLLLFPLPLPLLFLLLLMLLFLLLRGRGRQSIIQSSERWRRCVRQHRRHRRLGCSHSRIQSSVL